MFLKQINCGEQYEAANSDGEASGTKAVIKTAPGAALVTLNGWARFSQVQFSSEEPRCAGMKRMDKVDPTDAEVRKAESGRYHSYYALMNLSAAAFPLALELHK